MASADVELGVVAASSATTNTPMSVLILLMWFLLDRDSDLRVDGWWDSKEEELDSQRDNDDTQTLLR
jgi:hypothetical protein